MNWDLGLREILISRLEHFYNFIEKNSPEDVISNQITFVLTENGFKWSSDANEIETNVIKGENNGVYDDIYNSLTDIYLIFSQPTKFKLLYSVGLLNLIEINIEHHFKRNIGRISGIQRGEGLITLLKAEMDIRMDTFEITTNYLITRGQRIIFQGNLRDLVHRII